VADAGTTQHISAEDEALFTEDLEGDDESDLDEDELDALEASLDSTHLK